MSTHLRASELLASRSVRGRVWCGLGALASLWWGPSAQAQAPDIQSSSTALGLADFGADSASSTTAVDDLFWSTTSTTEPLFDVPLSAEELALIAALDTSTQAEVIAPNFAPVAPQLYESLARTLAEAQFERPRLSGTFRFDRRAARLLDGLRLETRSAQLWDEADPRLMNSEVVGPEPGSDPSGLRGALRYTTRRQGPALELGVQGGSFDRTASGYARTHKQWGSVSLSAGVSAGSLGRTGTSTTTPPTLRVQSNLHLSASKGHHRVDLSGAVLWLGDRLEENGLSGDHLLFVTGVGYRFQSETSTLSLQLGYNGHRLSDQSTVGRAQAVLSTAYKFSDGLTLLSSARAIRGTGERQQATTRRSEFDLLAGVEARWRGIWATLLSGAAGRKTQWLAIDAGDVRPIGRLELGLQTGSVKLSVSGGRGMQQPDVDQASARSLEHPVSGTWWGQMELGWSSERLSLRLVPFVSHTTSAGIRPRNEALVFADLLVLGFELDGHWWIARNLGAFATAGFAEGSSNGSTAEVQPIVQIAASVRWSRGIVRAELFGRFISSPVEIISDRNESFFGPGGEAGIYLGGTGSLELGSGFLLSVAVGNGLDTQARLLRPSITPRGFDARLGLSWVLF